MTTIASPRLSVTSFTSPTPTNSTPPTPSLSRTASPSRQSNPRRNRAALRDYYNLKASVPVDASSESQNDEIEVKESELDAEGFDAEAYVQEVLAGQDLKGVLRTEASLINGLLTPAGGESRGRQANVKGWQRSKGLMASAKHWCTIITQSSSRLQIRYGKYGRADSSSS